MIMDEELKALAEQALLNAFWTDFSALVNKYLEAAKGLDTEELEMRIGEHTSVYGRDDLAPTDDVFLNIWTQEPGMPNHDTILEALESEKATEVYLRGEKVFERRNGEWFWFEEKE
jgi:hypothetical protein